MKRTLVAVSVLATMVACKHKPPKGGPVPQACITIDSANKMVSSYLQSIQFAGNDSDVQSFTLDADALRYLLDSMPNSITIREVEVKFGHKLTYINSGHANQFAGYDNSALTLLMTGVNASGNYVNPGGAYVIDHARPCPNTCPPGNASSPLFSQ